MNGAGDPDWLAWILTFINMWEIIARTFFNSPTTWAHEASVMVFAALTILSGAYTLRYRGHVNMDLFYMNRRSPEAILDVISFRSSWPSALPSSGWLEFAYRSVKALEISQSDWAPPLWPIKLFIPLGAVLLLLQGCANLVSDIYTAITGKGVDA